MIIFYANTLGDAWIKSMRAVMEKGTDIYDENVRLREVRNLYVTIGDISAEDPIIKTYADPNRIDLMKKKYATCGLVGDYKVDYGSYIYNNNGVNQIDWVVDRIRKKPETKSATITLHRPGEDMLACLSMIDFKYRNKLLEMTVVYRSQNIYWSHPGNMLALRNIQEDVANALGFKVGHIELVVISAHVYEKDFSVVNTILDSSNLTSEEL